MSRIIYVRPAEFERWNQRILRTIVESVHHNMPMWIGTEREFGEAVPPHRDEVRDQIAEEAGIDSDLMWSWFINEAGYTEVTEEEYLAQADLTDDDLDLTGLTIRPKGLIP